MHGRTNPRTVSRRAMVDLRRRGRRRGLGRAVDSVSYDRVAAAIGSCGTKPLQVDFSTWANDYVPSEFHRKRTAPQITMSISDPGQRAGQHFWDNAGPRGHDQRPRQHPAITGMSNANFGEGVTVTFTFSTPIQPSFFLIDVDRGNERLGGQASRSSAICSVAARSILIR